MQFLALVLALTVGSVGARAALVDVPNFSFETGALAPEWTVFVQTNGSGSLAKASVGPVTAPPDGSHYLSLQAGSASGSISVQSTAPLLTVAADTKYTLTIAASPSFGPGSAGIRLDAGGASQAYLSIGSIGSFSDYTVSFTTGGPSDARVGTPLTIVMSMGFLSQAFTSIRFDNVRLDATVVPEPSGVALVALTSLLFTQRRRRAST